jgi:hypothetical protein
MAYNDKLAGRIIDDQAAEIERLRALSQNNAIVRERDELRAGVERLRIDNKWLRNVIDEYRIELLAENERLRAVIGEQPRDLQVADRLISELRSDNERLRAALRAIKDQLLPAGQTDWLSPMGKRIMEIIRSTSQKTQGSE